MEKHCNLTNSDFEKQFGNATLEPAVFSHEAHLRLAWIHIKKYGVEKAIENICTQIQSFAAAQGDHDKYNVTVTIAAVRVIYHFMLKSASSNFRDFILEFPRIKSHFRALLPVITQ
jgi:hypothetical protein